MASPAGDGRPLAAMHGMVMNIRKAELLSALPDMPAKLRQLIDGLQDLDDVTAYMECQLLALGSKDGMKRELEDLRGPPRAGAPEDDVSDAEAQQVLDAARTCVRCAEDAYIANQFHDRAKVLAALPESLHDGTHTALSESDLMKRYSVYCMKGSRHQEIVFKDKLGLTDEEEQALNKDRADLGRVMQRRRRLVNAWIAQSCANSNEDRMKPARERINKEELDKDLEKICGEQFFQDDMHRLRLLQLQANHAASLDFTGLDRKHIAEQCSMKFLSVRNLESLNTLRSGSDAEKVKFNAILADQAAILELVSPDVLKRFGDASMFLLQAMFGEDIDHGTLAAGMSYEDMVALVETAVIRVKGGKLSDDCSTALALHVRQVYDSGLIASAKIPALKALAFDLAAREVTGLPLGACDFPAPAAPAPAPVPAAAPPAGRPPWMEKLDAKKRAAGLPVTAEWERARMLEIYANFKRDWSASASWWAYKKGEWCPEDCAKAWKTAAEYHKNHGPATDPVTVYRRIGPDEDLVDFKLMRPLSAWKNREGAFEWKGGDEASRKVVLEIKVGRGDKFFDGSLTEEGGSYATAEGECTLWPERLVAKEVTTEGDVTVIKCETQGDGFEAWNKENVLDAKPADPDVTVARLPMATKTKVWEGIKVFFKVALALGCFALVAYGSYELIRNGGDGFALTRGWLDLVLGSVKFLLEVPSLYCETRWMVGQIFDKGWKAHGWEAKILPMLAKAAAVIGVIVTLVAFIFAVINLIREWHKGGLTIFYNVMMVVSAGLGLVAACISCAVVFGKLSASAGPVGLALALLALGIALIIGGFMMIFPPEPNFYSYMREEWPAEWSHTGDWPSAWDFLSIGEKIWAVSQIVIGGVELSDDRLARLLHSKVPCPFMFFEDSMENHFSRFALVDASDVPQPPPLGMLAEIKKCIVSFDPESGLVINLGLLRNGAPRVCSEGGCRVGDISGVARRSLMPLVNGKYVVTQHLDDKLGEQLFEYMVPYYEKLYATGTSRNRILPSIPSIAYGVSIRKGRLLLQPLMSGNVVCMVTDEEDAQCLQPRVERRCTGFAYRTHEDEVVEVSEEVVHSPWYVSRASPDAVEPEPLTLPLMAPLVGAVPRAPSQDLMFDLSQLWELDERFATVTSLLFDSKTFNMFFVCELGRLPLFPTATVQDLAVLLKLFRFQPMKYAAFSLDPADPKFFEMTNEERMSKAEAGELHYRRQVWPLDLFGTSVECTLFDADYHLKELAQRGVGSVGGIHQECGHAAASVTRVWLSCKSSSVRRHEASALWHDSDNGNRKVTALVGIDLQISVEARTVQGDGDGGMKDANRDHIEEVKERWAERMTAALQDYIDGHPALARLRDLCVLRECVIAMNDHEVPINWTGVDALSRPQYKVPDKAPMLARGGLFTRLVGGAELGLCAARRQVIPATGQMTRLNSILNGSVLEPRPQFCYPDMFEKDASVVRSVRQRTDTTIAKLANPFCPMAASNPSQCYTCQQAVHDPNQAHTAFQDFLGHKCCDRLECLNTATSQTGGYVVLSSLPSCAWCGENAMPHTLPANEVEAPSMSIFSDQPFMLLHGHCKKQWPGGEESDQKVYRRQKQAEMEAASKFIEESPQHVVHMLKPEEHIHQLGLPTQVQRKLLDKIRMYVRMVESLAGHGLSVQPSPEVVAALNRDWDALKCLCVTSEEETRHADLQSIVAEICNLCPAGHELQNYDARQRGVICDLCNAPCLLSFKCETCDFDVCQPCHKAGNNQCTLEKCLSSSWQACMQVDDALVENCFHCGICLARSMAIAVSEADGDALLCATCFDFHMCQNPSHTGPIRTSDLRHKGVNCQGCKLEILGKRYKNADETFNHSYCELCRAIALRQGHDHVLLNDLCIDGPHNSNTSAIVEWRAHLYRVAAQVLISMQTIGERVEIDRDTMQMRLQQSRGCIAEEAVIYATHMAHMATTQADEKKQQLRGWSLSGEERRRLFYELRRADAHGKAWSEEADYFKKLHVDALATARTEQCRLEAQTATDHVMDDVADFIDLDTMARQAKEDKATVQRSRDKLAALRQEQRLLLCCVREKAQVQELLHQQVALTVPGLGQRVCSVQQVLSHDDIQVQAVSSMEDIAGLEGCQVGALYLDGSDPSSATLAGNVSKALALDKLRPRILVAVPDFPREHSVRCGSPETKTTSKRPFCCFWPTLDGELTVPMDMRTDAEKRLGGSSRTAVEAVAFGSKRLDTECILELQTWTCTSCGAANKSDTGLCAQCNVASSDCCCWQCTCAQLRSTPTWNLPGLVLSSPGRAPMLLKRTTDRNITVMLKHGTRVPWLLRCCTAPPAAEDDDATLSLGGPVAFVTSFAEAVTLCLGLRVRPAVFRDFAAAHVEDIKQQEDSIEMQRQDINMYKTRIEAAQKQRLPMNRSEAVRRKKLAEAKAALSPGSVRAQQPPTLQPADLLIACERLSSDFEHLCRKGLLSNGSAD